MLLYIVHNKYYLKTKKNTFNFSIYKGKPVIIKGCSDQKIPLSAYSVLLEKLQLEAKSIMFGEACSSVPIYKSSNKS